MKKLLTKFKKKFSNYMISRMIKRAGFDKDKMYHIELCRGKKRCNRNVIDVGKTEELVIKNLENNQIATRLHTKLVNEDLILPHHMFKIAISGCVNGCSKPQIKDFAIIGQLKPKVNQQVCIQCGKCVRKCSEGAIKLSDSEIKINFDQCIYCGDCIDICPTNGITKDKEGYQIQAGGHLGRHPRLADMITNLSGSKETNSLLTKAINIFVEKGEGHERLGTTVDKLDINLK
ncbi:4Fe-4S binding protein [Selenihalanaerobacter shriftii]|uniref:4Fe-4S dicluster domain-containing protein n=1 Tax=Selenihalanaerobacter shriftii TaxID=142842 RepID=A0A1T4M7Z3_9FIRM|nr:4Fe-4S binding protein [Selenihalanaerobacter shriftii]SJZ63129.1 4Fe-4S dicluster domain-containing protein [Selenihalanaerobacter shriftii]